MGSSPPTWLPAPPTPVSNTATPIFEPIANVINGAIILLLCLGALYGGITSLLAGGREIDLGHALIYAVVSTFFCSILYLIEADVAERVNSELVRVDSKEWLVDTLLSATLLIGFLVAIGLDTLGYGHYNRYIDPMLVSLLALCATLIPIKVLGRNLREVLKIAPKGRGQAASRTRIEALRQRHGIECYSHLAKSGRRFDLELNILVAPARSGPSSARMPCARSSGPASATPWETPGCRSASPARNAGSDPALVIALQRGAQSPRVMTPGATAAKFPPLSRPHPAYPSLLAPSPVPFNPSGENVYHPFRINIHFHPREK